MNTFKGAKTADDIVGAAIAIGSDFSTTSGSAHSSISAYSTILTDVIEQLILAKMKNYHSFEYKMLKMDNITATQIATIAKIKYNSTIDNTIFFTEIDPTQVARLDDKLNLYTTQYTYKLCEIAAFERVKQCLLIDHVKPPLWAVESLSRTIKSKKNSKYADENKKLLENTVSKYPEFLYLTH